MKFEYKKQPDFRNPQKPWTSRPFIPVRLFHNNSRFEVYALVDSGADVCLFHVSIGEAIGINVKAGERQEFHGIEGKGGIDVYFHSIKLQIIGTSEKIVVRAGFIDSKSVSAILGQQDFFDNYHIAFKKDKEVVEIKERPKKSKQKKKD